MVCLNRVGSLMLGSSFVRTIGICAFNTGTLDLAPKLYPVLSSLWSLFEVHPDFGPA